MILSFCPCIDDDDDDDDDDNGNILQFCVLRQ